MSVYRRKNPRTGKRSRFFTCEFSVSGRLYKRGGFVDRESANHWKATEILAARRGAVGYVKPMVKAQVIPLIVQYIEYLTGKGRDSMYCYTKGRRLERLAGECGWQTIGNITRDSLETWTTSSPTWRNKKISNRTINQFIEAATEFCEWLWKRAKKLQSNPLADTERLQSKLNDEYRRAGSLEEIQNLLSTCSASNRLYYLFRLYCPLRGKTIAALTWGMLKLDATPPWIELPASINKSGRDERSPLRYDVAQQLRAEKRKAKSEDLVFPDAPSLDEFRVDLAAAEIPFDFGKNHQRLDYHAMRKTLVRLLEMAGVSLDQASQILHHKDIRTTKKHYGSSGVKPELGAAMEKLPDLGKMRRAQ